MAFIQVIDTMDHTVYVNVDHIVTVEENGPVTRIDLESDSQRDNCLLVKASVEHVMAMITEASARERLLG